jgi:DNA invertase Pin-like site-specific DNA recombinase
MVDIEEQYSAKTFHRPKWETIIEFIKKNKGRVDAIVFTKWDRFSRNAEYAYTELRKLEKMGVVAMRRTTLKFSKSS